MIIPGSTAATSGTTAGHPERSEPSLIDRRWAYEARHPTRRFKGKIITTSREWECWDGDTLVAKRPEFSDLLDFLEGEDAAQSAEPEGDDDNAEPEDIELTAQGNGIFRNAS